MAISGATPARALQAANQFTEFALATGPGQGRVPHVVFEVDVVVLDPHRERIPVDRVLQASIPWRLEVTVAPELRHQLAHEIP